MKRCTIRGCPGEYEEKLIDRLFQVGGKPTVVTGIPAEVCSVCGDTLLGLAASAGIDAALRRPPVRTAPVVEFPPSPAA